jgi:MoxR-like ATPase
VPGRKERGAELVGKAKIKEVNRLIRMARSLWDAHRNSACRRERKRAMALYESLTAAERDDVPQVLRVWLRYRSEKYFGTGRQGNGANS